MVRHRLNLHPFDASGKQRLRWTDFQSRRAGLDSYCHQHLIGRHIEELFAVTSPVRLEAACVEICRLNPVGGNDSTYTSYVLVSFEMYASHRAGGRRKRVVGPLCTQSPTSDPAQILVQDSDKPAFYGAIPISPRQKHSGHVAGVARHGTRSGGRSYHSAADVTGGS